MPALIIYGAPGCGKDAMAERLKEAHGCQRVIHDWDGETPLQDGDLALTNLQPPFANRAGAFVMPYGLAMAGVKR